MFVTCPRAALTRSPPPLLDESNWKEKLCNQKPISKAMSSFWFGLVPNYTLVKIRRRTLGNINCLCRLHQLNPMFESTASLVLYFTPNQIKKGPPKSVYNKEIVGTALRKVNGKSHSRSTFTAITRKDVTFLSLEMETGNRLIKREVPKSVQKHGSL